MAEFNPFPGGYFLGKVETFRTTSDAAVAANTLVTAGRLRGVTRQAFAAGDPVIAFLSSRHDHYNVELAAVAGAAVTQGTEIYLDSNGKATTTAASNTLIGCLYQALDQGDTYADVLIFNPAPSDNSGLTTAQVNALIDTAVTTHAALTAGTSEGNVHPGPEPAA